MSPALADRFLTTGPPEKSPLIFKSAQCEAEKGRKVQMKEGEGKNREEMAGRS